MNLARRVKKLQKQGKQVEINKFYLLDVSSYRASEWVRNFFIGLVVVMILGFFVWWAVSSIMISQRNSSNVQLRQLEIDKQSQERIDKEAAKQKYVDSCKSAGKAPTDMSDYEGSWECK